MMVVFFWLDYIEEFGIVCAEELVHRSRTAIGCKPVQ